MSGSENDAVQLSEETMDKALLVLFDELIFQKPKKKKQGLSN